MSSDFDIYYNTIDKLLIDVTKTMSTPNSQTNQSLMKDTYQKIKNIEEYIGLAENEICMISNAKQCEQAQVKLDFLNSQLQMLVQKIKQQNPNIQTSSNDVDTLQQQVITDMNKVQIASVVLDAAKVQLNDADLALAEVIILNDQITNILEIGTVTLNNINDNLNGIQAERVIIKKQFRAIARQITGNTTLMLTIFIILVVIICLIIWSIIKACKE
ncbi:Syntaphilin_family protein [Hexamita inflata]|uniref:Syntaphilin family protein n=1 Tax=Hexamita inflata TaxID=28002 RepID=A0AA86TMP7_9EUKA|nr:Syntaphilin family protein [Hexamita inflata]